MSRDTAHNCDKCGEEVPNGHGFYLTSGDRVCHDCMKENEETGQ
jgi:formylmethanofuran dehydrogenase subunit E